MWWREHEELTELLEEQSRLWDKFDSDYSKREKRDKTSIQSDCRKLEREITYVNTKINNFCAQLRLQIGKVKKTKSGQATSCINFHGFTGRDCSYLQIRCNLVALEITLTLGIRVENWTTNLVKFNIQSKAKLKHKMSKKGLEEKKMEVLEECLHMLTSCMSSKKVNLQQNLWTFDLGMTKFWMRLYIVKILLHNNMYAYKLNNLLP